MHEALIVMRREIKSYFCSPIAYVFGMLLRSHDGQHRLGRGEIGQMGVGIVGDMLFQPMEIPHLAGSGGDNQKLRLS